LRTLPQQEAPQEQALSVDSQATTGPKDMTYTDEEIEAAFRFMDLDKNGYLGANELRHCLICMGEMITDEEVDMMISMVDGDGDGQVSFTEFYTIIRDPDPGRPDFGKEGVSAAHVRLIDISIYIDNFFNFYF
jgi:hypothetical protein